MPTTRQKRPSIVVWTLVFGLAFNVLGWLGNNLLLGELWDVTSAAVKSGFSAPWSGLAKEAVSLVSDFIYAFAAVWLFAQSREQTLVHAIKLMLMIWAAGAALTYLVLVNAGFLPLEIAVQTSLLALVIFLASAPVLALTMKDRTNG